MQRLSLSNDGIFSERLRQIMNDTRTTQKQLGAALGIKPQSISQYVTGQNLPDIYRLKDIADYFDISSDWLLGRTNDRDRRPSSVDQLGLSEQSMFILSNMLTFNSNLSPFLTKVFRASFETLIQHPNALSSFLVYSYRYSLKCAEKQDLPPYELEKGIFMPNEKEQFRTVLISIVNSYCDYLENNAKEGHPIEVTKHDD